MIDPKSLRIGNTFLSPDGTPSIVTRLDASIHANKWFYNPAECNGIPLSSTVLEKAGAKVVSDGEYFQNWQFPNGLIVSYCKKEYLQDIAESGCWYTGEYIKIPSLHWLQNYYYFAISGGRELDIKL